MGASGLKICAVSGFMDRGFEHSGSHAECENTVAGCEGTTRSLRPARQTRGRSGTSMNPPFGQHRRERGCEEKSGCQLLEACCRRKFASSVLGGGMDKRV